MLAEEQALATRLRALPRLEPGAAFGETVLLRLALSRLPALEPAAGFADRVVIARALRALPQEAPGEGFAERVLVAHALRQWPQEAPRAGFADRVMARVRPPLPATPAATVPARRRAPVSRRARLAAGALLVAGAGASVAWSLAHPAWLGGVSGELLGGAVAVLLATLKSVLAVILEQPWYATVRSIVDTPTRMGMISASFALAYLTGLLALRRLLTLPAPRVAHASR